jgi:hypothetical protein
MKIHWVTNEQRYSKFFRFLFGEQTSHVGAEFSIGGAEMAIDLNKPYGTLWDMGYWRSKYNIVWSCEIPLSSDEEWQVFNDCRKYAVLRKYDMNGYYYGIWRGILKKFFGRPLPSVNKWAANTGSMCQEIVVPVTQSNPIVARGIAIDLMHTTAKTPDMVIKIMKKATAHRPDVKWVFNG